MTRLLAGEINLSKIWRKRIKKISGTKLGGLKASKTNRAKYGENYYAEMGKKGGQKGHTGGFASNNELARSAGAKGGRSSKRGRAMQKKLGEIFEPFIRGEIEKGNSVHSIATRIGVSDITIKRFCQDNGLLDDKYTKPAK